MMVARMRRSEQVFAAILDPAHRVVARKRQGREDDLLRVEPRLRAEAAADIGGDDADAARLDLKKFGERDAHRVRRLGRGIDDDLVEPMVVKSDDGAAFERQPRLPVHAEFAGHGKRGGAGRSGDIAAFDKAFDIEIIAPALMHEGAAAPHVARRVHDWRQHLEIDGHGGCQILGLGAGRGETGGDRLADIAHLVDGQRRP